jgi:Icc protein
MRNDVLVVQVTDSHLSADPERDYRGENPYRNLLAVLNTARTLNPDILLATGDLSEDGSTRSYKTIKSLFSEFGVPVLALPGNHDAAGLMARFFQGSPVGEVTVTDIGHWQILRLNSCVPGQAAGCLPPGTLAQLDNELGKNQGRPKLIAVHHQPYPIGSPWIDKYPLEGGEALISVVHAHPDVRVVAWGHVHQAFDEVRQGTVMLGGPSCVINSYRNVKRFSPDNSGPACRWIRLGADGSVKTGVVFATGSQSDSGSNNHSTR